MTEVADRKVRMSPELMEQWASRDVQGHVVKWNWGEPDDEGFYTPIITTTDDGVRLVTAESLARALQKHDPDDDGNLSGNPTEYFERQAAAILAALNSP